MKWLLETLKHGGWVPGEPTARVGTFCPSLPPLQGGKRGWRWSSITRANDLINHTCVMKPSWKNQKDRIWRASGLVNAIHTESGTPHSMGTEAPRPHPVFCVFIQLFIHILRHRIVFWCWKKYRWCWGGLSKRLWPPWLFMNHSFQDPVDGKWPSCPSLS